MTNNNIVDKTKQFARQASDSVKAGAGVVTDKFKDMTGQSNQSQAESKARDATNSAKGAAQNVVNKADA